MAKIRRSATIDARVERIFDVIERPENWPRFVPHVEASSQIRRTDGRVGDAFRLTYHVIGITFDEMITIAAYQPPSVYQMVVEGRMSGTQDWSLEGAGGQTMITVDVDYHLPGGPIGRAFDALLLKPVNARTIDRMFENLGGLIGHPEAPSQERSRRANG